MKINKVYRRLLFQVAVSCFLGFNALAQQDATECHVLHDSLNTLADEYYSEDASRSLYYAQELLKAANRCSDKTIYFSAYQALGWAHLGLSNFPESIKYAEKALHTAQLLKDKDKILNSCNLLGNIYLEIPDREFALDYFNQGIQVAYEAGDEEGLSNLYNNIAIAYELFEDLNASLKYYLLAKETFEKSDNDRDKGLIYLNIGDLYFQINEFDSASYYFKKSRENLNYEQDADILIILYLCKAAEFARLDRFETAISYLDSCKLLLGDGSSPTDFVTYYRSRAKILFDKKNFKEAYLSLEQAFLIKDTILSKEIMHKLRDAQIAAVTDKKEAEIQSLTQEREIQDLKLSENRAKQRNYFLGFILVTAVLCLLVFMLINNAKKNKKLRYRNNIIESQSELIQIKNLQLEQSNKEILDSIKYAKRIQTAILPSEKFVKEFLPQHFILYKPKDIVAGDFYWLECPPVPFSSSRQLAEEMSASSGQRRTVYFAAADCTGHGVPGAMVSVVCHNALNRSIREYGHADPGKILDKTCEIVVQEFEKSDEDVKDGMDISLCALQGNKLSWSGANNPLWIIADENRTDLSGFKNLTGPKGINGKTLYEIKPDKQPIGKVDNPQPFITHTIELHEGDIIYVFTDGYQDQFGGPKGKKFKASQLKELLLSIQHKTMVEQKAVLQEAFENWKGDLEQVDDICIIGLRI